MALSLLERKALLKKQTSPEPNPLTSQLEFYNYLAHCIAICLRLDVLDEDRHSVNLHQTLFFLDLPGCHPACGKLLKSLPRHCRVDSFLPHQPRFRIQILVVPLIKRVLHKKDRLYLSLFNNCNQRLAAVSDQRASREFTKRQAEIACLCHQLSGRIG